MNADAVFPKVFYLLSVLAVAWAIASNEAQADVDITTPSGTQITRVEAADVAEVTEAAGRADFMRNYAAALAAPTVQSQCTPSIVSVAGQQIIAMSCTQTYFDPSRLRVDPAILARATSWADVADNFVGGVTGVAKAAVLQTPTLALAYAVNQARKSGRTQVYDDSFNTDSKNDKSDNSTNSDTSHNSDSSSHDTGNRTADSGSIVGDGRMGDDSTSTPTVVNQPAPTVVRPEVVNPVVVEPVIIEVEGAPLEGDLG